MEAERPTNSTLENIPDGFAALDREFRHIYVNSVWEAITGKSRDESLGRTIWEVSPPSLRGVFERQCRRAVTENVPILFEAYYSTRGRWLMVSGYPSGKGGLAVYARDITDQKNFETALLASEKRFRRYFELGLIGMAITSPWKGCIEVNNEMCRILGYLRSELLGIRWAEITHPDDLVADLANFRRVLAGECDGYSIEKRFIRKDRQIIHAAVSLRCVRAADGSVQYFLALLQDITARKRAEESLAAERTRLEQSVAERTSQLLAVNEELRKQINERERAEQSLQLARDELARVSRVTTMGELTASIAHEINQPLTAVVANANACQRYLSTPSPDLEEIGRALCDIVEAGARAGQVTARILGFVKKSVPSRDWVDMNRLVEEVLVFVGGELQRHQVIARMELWPALPKALGDRVQLQQVILNIVMNGIEAMSAIPDRPRILQIRSQGHGSNLEFSFADSGVGFGSDEAARMFEAFYTTKSGGMGMGLPISRSIIEAHGGRLWATSNLEHGATFEFTLPAQM